VGSNRLSDCRRIEGTDQKPTSGAFHRHDTGSDVDLDIFRDLELFLGVDVQHLEKAPGGGGFGGI
jgi:hypothetical protein